MIYLDNSATTQPAAEVLDVYLKVAKDYFGNPSSLHTLGMEQKLCYSKRANELLSSLVRPQRKLFLLQAVLKGIIWRSKGPLMP